METKNKSPGGKRKKKKKENRKKNKETGKKKMKLDRFVCYFSEKLAQNKTKKNEKKGNY